MTTYDLTIIGAGPAGCCCAATALRAGLSVALVDRERFPRHKVCGDCLNPSSWRILEKLGVGDAIRKSEHAELLSVTMESSTGGSVSIPLPAAPRGELAIKREILDNLLLENARSLGATTVLGSALERIETEPDGWTVHTAGGRFRSRALVAADGRNSSVARLLGGTAIAPRHRVAFQIHLPLPEGFRNTVLLKVLPEGYCGACPVNDRELNLCLVSRTGAIGDAKRWAQNTFGISPELRWNSIAPLQRADRDPFPSRNLFFIGDAARVVEPFTGEGTFYAMCTGELAANALIELAGRGRSFAAVQGQFKRDYADLYRNRLWVNRLTRFAVTHPSAGDAIIAAGRAIPALLPFLTARIVRP